MWRVWRGFWRERVRAREKNLRGYWLGKSKSPLNGKRVEWGTRQPLLVSCLVCSTRILESQNPPGHGTRSRVTCTTVSDGGERYALRRRPPGGAALLLGNRDCGCDLQRGAWDGVGFARSPERSGDDYGDGGPDKRFWLGASQRPQSAGTIHDADIHPAARCAHAELFSASV
jgi:hypothetical protein